ncbi:uncharacterized protein LOC125070008 [Vanessa atalanta]|uniref:uncharacterized protein LOC125070008 n=1 Tax=Vanessa atalanta TaxID=42275 RepID=UPI000E77BF1C|nr:uncharacterized protein LOC113400596 [Vanessa tameamea]XP_047535629.1 uncharacterized protein LOC125070008 [Vanessa atalanta]
MSTAGNVQQLQQDLQNELTTANQLLRLISLEVQKIKNFTNPGGEFEENIKQNVSTIASLANIQQINITNLPPVKHLQLDLSQHTNQNMSYEQHDSFRNSMDESQ